MSYRTRYGSLARCQASHDVLSQKARSSAEQETRPTGKVLLSALGNPCEMITDGVVYECVTHLYFRRTMVSNKPIFPRMSGFALSLVWSEPILALLAPYHFLSKKNSLLT